MSLRGTNLVDCKLTLDYLYTLIWDGHLYLYLWSTRETLVTLVLAMLGLPGMMRLLLFAARN